MRHTFRSPLALLIFAGALALLAGCDGGPSPTQLMNQPPTVRLTAAPVSELKSDSVFYAYRINWVGYDPDGRVDYFMYAIDPPSVDVVDSTWTRTTLNEQFLLFRARNPDNINTTGGSSTADESHVFAIVAVDNSGKMSVPISRAFFTYTIAPVVEMTDPTAGHLNIVSPSVHLVWTGRDPDGVFTQKPIKYKFRLFKSGAPPSDFPFPVSESDFLVFATANPDSVRKGYAPTFPGWDSTSAETTETQYTNLIPETNYLFIVTGFDEAGAYDPVFSLNSNVLQLYVTFAGNAAPLMTVFNDFFSYTWPIGGNLSDSRFWFNIEVPGDANANDGREEKVTFNWFATPQGGSSIRRYRWVMDLVDLDDETPRSDENTDVKHWSIWDLNNLSATVGPFYVNNEAHNFIVQAEDNNNLVTTVVVAFRAILFQGNSPEGKELLIVNDTRFQTDDQAPGGGTRPPAGRWPTAAELDTFFSATGGKPWKSYPAGTLTTPGIFQGYDFDTLGTRGLRDPIVPLSVLAQYRHVVWLIDANGAGNTANQFDRIRPTTSLREMNGANKANTLATYMRQGGLAWLLGNGVARASLEPRQGNAPNPGRWNTRDGDLVAGRMLYDFAHMRTELSQSTGSEMVRGSHVISPPRDDPPGRGWNGQPPYDNMPQVLERRGKSSTTPPDPLPPFRDPSQFYVNNFFVELCTNLGQVGGNFIREDLNGSAPGGVESTLDTLYYYLNQSRAGFDPIAFYYHGLDNVPVIYCGFPIWEVKKAQAIDLIDFVFRDIWHIQPTSTPNFVRVASNPANVAAVQHAGTVQRRAGILQSLGIGRSVPTATPTRPSLLPLRPRN
jgi:hypothetical protein